MRELQVAHPRRREVVLMPWMVVNMFRRPMRWFESKDEAIEWARASEPFRGAFQVLEV